MGDKTLAHTRIAKPENVKIPFCASLVKRSLLGAFYAAGFLT